MSTTQYNVQERTLYGFWLSPYMSQVAHVLTESGLPYHYERVSPFQGSTHSTEHKARNPLGKIPTLQDTNGVYVSESQAICRYLARMYPGTRTIYPVDDPVRCAEIDAKNDFITFSLGGPFFNWFVFGAYFPRAFGLKTEHESQLFSLCSLYMIKGALGRLIEGSTMAPFVLGERPCLPDFQLFHMLEVGKTFSKLFDMPSLNLVEGDERLQRFYDAMAALASTTDILAAQASELETTTHELFEEFGEAYRNTLSRNVLSAMFGHEV